MIESKNESLLERGVSNLYPSKEFISQKLAKGQKLTIYLGIDPTGPTLHIGHTIAIRKLAEFQKAGHKVILLMGDFTAMIGDPSDKDATRIALTHKQVLENLKNYKKQAGKLLKFTGKNKAEIKFNSKWLSKMKFEDILGLASKMTVSQMLERDMFDKRFKEGKSIYLHEFFYPLMQGYDSVAMNVDGEVGGNDQTFNMLTGRNLLKIFKNKEKFVITMKLLEDNSGKKMGKTEGNMISLSDDAYTMYGKIMSWNDSLIIPAFELCTDVSMLEIEKIARDIASLEINPRDLKMKLARNIISVFHKNEDTKKAEAQFIQTFQKNEIPENIIKISVNSGSLLSDILLKENIVTSKSDFKRLVDERAIANLDLDEKITSYNERVKNGVYKIGKMRFCKIDVK